MIFNQSNYNTLIIYIIFNILIIIVINILIRSILRIFGGRNILDVVEGEIMVDC